MQVRQEPARRFPWTDRYVAQQIVGERVIADLRTGKLGPSELEKARAAIDAAKLIEQPPSSGVQPPVNAQEVSVEAVGVKRVVVGPPGAAGAATAAMQGPVADLVRTLDELTKR